MPCNAELTHEGPLPACRGGGGAGGGGRRGRPRGPKNADGSELEAHEAPVDIYEGEQDDELRPTRPGQVGHGRGGLWWGR